ncbi:MAG: flippase-like domain-containing protein [Bacteroidetes bacterium]|nr:flippase-like domain-containing protein [Bacteroidota bacterium]MCL5267566.1 flippase-like domain-containing protein [Bacteroidota bacterium]
MLRKLRGKLFISIAIAALIGVAFSLYANTEHIKEAFATFAYELLPIVLTLTVANYLVRFVRWQFYLHALRIDIPRSESLGVFMSSLSMAVTPGKMGELVKSYFLKSIHSVPISKSAPIILAERVTDVLALLIISMIGAYSIGYEKKIIIIFSLMFIAGIAVIASRTMSMKIIRFAERFRFVAKWIKPIEIAYESSHTLLVGRVLLVSTLFGLVAWFSECIGFFFVLDGLGVHLKLLSAAFIYAFSTVVGAVSFLPGGLGATETSLAGLLILAKIPKGVSVAATFIIRACTLWFAVIIGAGVLSYMQKRYAVTLNERFENN